MKQENEYLKTYVEYLKNERQKIQKNFKFIIPLYILDEIIETRDKKRVENILCLINLALINKSLTKKAAEELKENLVIYY